MLLIQHFLTLIFFILCILCDKLPLATATSANNRVASDPSTNDDSIRSVRFQQSAIIAAVAINATTTITTTTTITKSTTIFNISSMVRNDLLCNNDSEFVCICQQNAGNLLKYYILCNELIELDELPVIEMNIRSVKLSARLHTNETYESYFKRRIAAVVSNYCEQQADECMATTLRIKKENVVLLSIKPNNLQSTTIGFVITKSQRRSILNNRTILDSTKVKYVLSAQLAALSRILGGVRIEQVEMAIMKKYRDTDSGETTQRDNLGLLVILSITAAFLTTTYTVAAIRVCRSCYAKRQAKKANKLNKISETPNYGTCIQPKQNEVHRNYEIRNSIKTRTPERNDTNNLNSGEIAVMDLHQMRRMFQCDPSQLPAEEALALLPTSNDLFVMYASKFLRESKSQINDLRPNYKVHQSREAEVENRNFSLSQKTDKTFQNTRNIVEVPQKYTNILAKDKQIVGAFPPYDSNSTTYFYQSEYEFFDQQDKVLPIPIWNQLTAEEPSQSTRSQSETISEFMNSNPKKLKIDEQLEKTQNQLAIGNESTWLPNKELRHKSYSLTSSFSGSSFDEANHCNAEIINLELYHQLNRGTKHGIKTEIVGLKRVSLTDQSNHPQPEYSDCFTNDEKHIHIVRKSQTAHQFDDWSSESDDEGSDVYHKLSEAEEEKEIDRNLELVSVNCAEKVKDFTEDFKISQNKNSGLNSNIKSFIYTKQIKINTAESYYEQLQKSSSPPNSLNLSSISNKFTSEEFVNFSSTDDLK